MEINEPIVIIDLAENGGFIQLSTKEEFEKWIAEETVQWKWLKQARLTDASIPNVFVAFQSVWSALSAAIASVPDRKDENKFKDFQTKIANQLQAAYGPTGSVIHSNSARAKFIFNLKDRDPSLAAHVATWLSSAVSPNHNTPKAIEGAFEAMQFKKGLSNDSALAVLKTVEEMKVDFSKSVAEYESELGSLRVGYQDLETTAQKLSLKQTSDFDHLLEDLKTEKANLFALYSDELKALKTKYEDFMALKAPVQYWHDRRNWNYCVSAISALLFLLLIKIGFHNADGVVVRLHKDGLIQWGGVAYTVFVLTIFFWLSRLFVRVFLSNLHLATDASERAVLIQTFLSMIGEKDAVDQTTRSNMLASVFRPSTSGLIKDDALPHVLYEWITRVGNK